MIGDRLRFLFLCLSLAPVLAGCALFPSKPLVSEDVDWERFVDSHGFQWNRVPDYRGDSAFIGNGMMGSTIWAAKGEALHWDLGRCDVYGTGARVASRVPIGKLVMKTWGTPRGGSMRLSLAKGEASGKVVTDKGAIEWRSIMPHDAMVGLIEYSISGKESVKFLFNRTLPISSNKLRGMLTDYIKARSGELPKGFPKRIVDFSDLAYQPIYRKLALDPKNKSAFDFPDMNGCVDHGIQWRVQRFKNGGGYVVAWGTSGQGGGVSLCAYSIDYVHRGIPSPDRAVGCVRDALKRGYKAAAEGQYAWELAHLSKSFLSVPDKTIEAYYWRQIYKMGAATRPDGVVLDEIGPWFRATGWARVWCNINIQIAYHSMMPCGHFELCAPFLKVFDDNWEKLAAAVPEKYRGNGALAVGRTMDIFGNTGWHWEYGNLAWVAHDYWMYCRYLGDDERLLDKCYPLMKGAAAFMMNALRKDAKGVYHFPPDVSPEYTNERYADTNYNLGLLRWALRTLLHINGTYGLNDPAAARWKEVLENLAPYPVDSNGLMVAKGLPFAKSHRHYSHLLAFYPLACLSLSDPRERSLAEKSFDHWVKLSSPGPKRKGWNSFSYFGAAPMAAWLGRGDEAAEFLREGIAGTTPNTFFRGPGPAIESVLCGTVGTCAMLLGSATHDPAERRLSVFSAIPKGWRDAAFRGLRGEGGFAVSAAMRDGAFAFVEVESLAGRPFVLDIPDTDGDVTVLGSGEAVEVAGKRSGGRRIFTVILPKGARIALVSKKYLDEGGKLVVGPVSAIEGEKAVK